MEYSTLQLRYLIVRKVPGDENIQDIIGVTNTWYAKVTYKNSIWCLFSKMPSGSQPMELCSRYKSLSAPKSLKMFDGNDLILL